jgi:hypothetical protein
MTTRMQHESATLSEVVMLLSDPILGKRARIAVRNHYGLTRPVTDAEVIEEVANLRRRGLWSLDDSQVHLHSALSNALRVHSVADVRGEI